MSIDNRFVSFSLFSKQQGLSNAVSFDLNNKTGGAIMLTVYEYAYDFLKMRFPDWAVSSAALNLATGPQATNE